jgi:hypothetical protein
MPPTNRRPCAIDTSMHFCPHEGCDYQGWLGLGNLRANGHPSGGPWRQLYCRSCDGYFLETHGTLFHGKRLSVELIVRVLACLAEGLGIRATARVFEVDPNTVLQWLVEAAEQLGPAGAFAQEVTVLPLNMSKSEDEIRHGMIIGTHIFNENPNIRLFQPYLWLKYRDCSFLIPIMPPFSERISLGKGVVIL